MQSTKIAALFFVAAIRLCGQTVNGVPVQVSGIARTDVAQTFAGTQTFSGQLQAANGTSGAPAYSFSAVSSTGMYRAGADGSLQLISSQAGIAVTASNGAPFNIILSGGGQVQIDSINEFAFVTADFTTSGIGTALEAITGLTWTIPASTAVNGPFSCHIVYHQNVATAAVAFGIQQASNAPTQINTYGVEWTSATAATNGSLIALASTTATAIVSATPSAITTNWVADLHGVYEEASVGSSSAITIRVSTATAADTVTVKRGSFCRVGF
jgi:hypothetical protein